MNPPETFKVCRCYDPEIIAHNPDEAVIKYMAERDFDSLHIPPEAAPVIFTCRLLTRAQMRLVRSQTNDANAYELSFRFGVLEVANLPSPSGPRTVEPARSRPGEPITDDGLDSLGLGQNAEQEIGMVIRTRSFLDPDVPLSCLQLASSVHAYSVVAVRHAARLKDSSTPPGDVPP